MKFSIFSVIFAVMFARSDERMIDAAEQDYIVQDSHHMTNPGTLWWLLEWMVPDNLIESNVFFYLYTRYNREAPQQLWLYNRLSLKNSFFDFTKKTVVLISGYHIDYHALSVQGPKENYLKYYDYNVIALDYGNINQDAGYLWIYTVTKGFKIGGFLGKFLRFLIDEGANPDDIHIIGHSLGAHIAGSAGKFVKMSGRQIGRITGLDPCSPIYNHNTPEYRLDANDAKFTDCIFTTFGSISMDEPTCHANFFPNGVGVMQPGCGDYDAGCAHSRPVDFFIESIEPNRSFSVQRCAGIPMIQKPARCFPTGDTFMGEYANPLVKGLFYLKTNGVYPFSQG